MPNLEYLICPKDHNLPFTRDSYARDFSDGDIDVMTLQPMYENGLYCLQCDRPYGLSKLKEPSQEKNPNII
ncbi:MAG: hypothetical protein Q8R18_00325 [bacterium]|nr:hypothetical protein [bacterium]